MAETVRPGCSGIEYQKQGTLWRDASSRVLVRITNSLKRSYCSFTYQVYYYDSSKVGKGERYGSRLEI